MAAYQIDTLKPFYLTQYEGQDGPLYTLPMMFIEYKDAEKMVAISEPKPMREITQDIMMLTKKFLYENMHKPRFFDTENPQISAEKSYERRGLCIKVTVGYLI